MVIYRYMKYYFVHQCLNLISLCLQTRFGMLGKVYSEFLFVVNQNYCCVPFPGFLSHSDRILARFQLGNFFIIKNIQVYYEKSD